MAMEVVEGLVSSPSIWIVSFFAICFIVPAILPITCLVANPLFSDIVYFIFIFLQLLESILVSVLPMVFCQCRRQGKTPSRRNPPALPVPQDSEECPSNSSPLVLEPTISFHRPQAIPSRPPMHPADLEVIPSSSIPPAFAMVASTKPTLSPRLARGDNRSTRWT